jgi:hypothetical protein
MQQALVPGNISAKGFGDVWNYLTNPTVGGTVEHLTPDVKLPGFVKKALSVVPGGEKWASDPRSVARLTGDVGATLVTPPAAKAGALAPRLEGEAAEKARQAVGAFERVGAKPSAAMIAPKVRSTGIIVGQNPIVGGPIRKAIHQTEKAVQERAEKFRQGTPERAGERVSKGLQRFQETSPETSAALREGKSGFRKSGEALEGEAKEISREATVSSMKRAPVRHVGFGPKSAVLYHAAEEKIGPLSHPIIASATRAAVGRVTKMFDNPALNQIFGEDTVKSLRAVLESVDGKLSFEDLRRLRSSYRIAMKKALQDPSVRADINEADVRGVYDAMTGDLQKGAGMLGTLWGGAERGAAAAKSWRQADAFYRAGLDRIDDALSKYYGKGTDPAAVFHSLFKAAQGGSRQDLKKLLQVRRSLSPEDWKAFASTVIDQMGRVSPGQASAEKEFSLETFLTNFTRLNEPAASETSGVDSGFKVLFEGNYGNDTASVLRDMQTVASHYKELMRGRNISYSAPHILAGLLPLGITTIAHNPLLAAVTLGGGFGASSLLSNPSFIKWLARVPTSGSEADVARVSTQMKAWLASAGVATSIGRERLDEAKQGQSGAEMPPDEGPPKPATPMASYLTPGTEPPPQQQPPQGAPGMIGQ